MQIEKVYEPQRFEPHWAQWWIDRGVFRADVNQPGPVFSTVIPPPNVTGRLHMGHMLNHTLLDVATRWHRMRGDNTLWLPGTDHAGIATQMVVERELAKEGLTRRDVGREKFVERVWQWKEEYGGFIGCQMVRLGDSCDWDRARFTMDEGLSRAVREIFVRLYEKNLIYRGEYMVNWCPRCSTAISDLETVHEEMQGSLWHIRYPVVGMPGRFLTVATTRPETMLGDTAVAVHPDDERYRDLHGRSVQLPLMGREIPVILDELANPEFGTGVVKLTPAHDPNDFEAGRRHNLPLVRVIGPDARMTTEAGELAGLDRFEARKRVVAALEEQGLLDGIQPHTLSVGTCQRCKTIIEPLVSTQWFVKMQPLAEPAIRVVEEGRIRFIPENWASTYFHWMRNIRDWCISRQLWWGHRIPAWYCPDGHITVAREDVAACGTCGSTEVEQDHDVLDTWFSSGLWPFSTLGWPDKTPDLERYYPTSLLITGYDILFFWVARMIVMGLEAMGEVPFHTVYLHPLVRDAERQKMSKTKGNVIDPIDLTERFGTDAVRFSLLNGAAPGSDISMTEDRLASARSFANKIWNAARLIQMNMERSGIGTVESLEPELEGASVEDRWIFHRLNECAAAMNRAIEQHRYHDAAGAVYGFFWDEFCDWYLELKKLRFRENSGLTQDWQNLLAAFERALRLLHPVMPFITEELWQRLTKDVAERQESLAQAAYPEFNAALSDAEAERDVAVLQEMITGARTLKADMKEDSRKVLDGTLYVRGRGAELARRELAAVQEIAKVRLTVQEGTAPQMAGAVRSTPEFDLLLHVSAEQAAAQRTRLEKEIANLEKQAANHRRQLGDETFTGKAPAKVVDGMRQKLAEYEAQLAQSRKTLEAMGGSAAA